MAALHQVRSGLDYDVLRLGDWREHWVAAAACERHGCEHQAETEDEVKNTLITLVHDVSFFNLVLLELRKRHP